MQDDITNSRCDIRCDLRASNYLFDYSVSEKILMDEKIARLHSEIAHRRTIAGPITPISIISPARSSAVTSSTPKTNDNLKRINYNEFLTNGIIFNVNDNILYPYGGKKYSCSIAKIDPSKTEMQLFIIPEQQIPNLDMESDNGFWVSERAIEHEYDGFLFDNVSREILSQPNKLISKLSSYCNNDTTQILLNGIWSTKQVYVKFVSKRNIMNNSFDVIEPRVPSINKNLIDKVDITALEKIVHKVVSSYNEIPTTSNDVLIRISCLKSQINQMKVDCNNKTMLSLAVV